MSCGYSVRFETVMPRPYGAIMYCTVGKTVTLSSDTKIVNVCRLNARLSQMRVGHD